MAAPDGPPGDRRLRALVEFGEELRAEGVDSGTAELLDAFAVLAEVPWTEPEDFREALAATLAKSQEDRRIFELVFDRFFFRAAEAAALREGVREDGRRGGDRERRRRRRDRPRRAAPPDRRGAARRARRRACATSRGWRSRRSGARARARASSASTCSASAARSACAPSRSRELARGRPAPRRRCRATRCAASRRCCAASSSAGRSSARETLPPSRPLNELDRALPSGPLQDLAAVHRVVAQLKRRLKTQGQEHRGHAPPRARRRAPHDARLAADRRRAGRPALQARAPAAAGDLRAVRRVDVA